MKKLLTQLQGGTNECQFNAPGVDNIAVKRVKHFENRTMMNEVEIEDAGNH